MSKLLIACGGTGGHLAPGIALAEEMQERGFDSLLLISRKTIDQQLTEKYPQHRFESVPGVPLLFTAAGVLHFAIAQTRGLVHAWRLIRRERPRMIVGFGGFTTAAVIVAGWMLRVPVALHDSNRVPGRAVRMMARFARRVYLPRGIRVNEVSLRKLRHAPLPVRREIQRLPRGESAEKFGLDPNRLIVVVLGGSQGAQALNRWAERAAPELAERGVQMLVVTGPGKREGQTTVLDGPDDSTVWAKYIPFCDDMAALLSMADLVVSRSGAGTIAELIRIAVPSVLVPYPHADDNHQVGNAIDFASAGGAVLVEETQIDQLQRLVVDLVTDQPRLAEMRAHVGHVELSSTLELMFNDIESLAKGARDSHTTSPWMAHA